jgi:RNA polymerase sigma factor (sigma-70 family)
MRLPATPLSIMNRDPLCASLPGHTHRGSGFGHSNVSCTWVYLPGGGKRVADPDQEQGEPREVSAPSASNSSAVSQLFREHNRVLVAYLTARLRSEQEAREVAQEAYVRLLQLHEPGTPSLLRAYLFKTATNLAIDRLRHRRVRQRTEEQPELFAELDPTPNQMDDQTDQLLGYLQEMPIKCQQVFKLHRLEEVPQREVAARLGFSERMVRRYVTYAMVYCHLRLQGMTPDQVRQKVSL